MAELNETVKFNAYVEEFFLILFNVVGVWIIQPRTQRFLAGEPMKEPKPSPKSPVQEKVDDFEPLDDLI